MALPPFERAPSRLPFAYSRVGVLFLICSQIATDVLENFLGKKLMFSKPIFSIPYYFIYDYVADTISLYM